MTHFLGFLLALRAAPTLAAAPSPTSYVDATGNGSRNAFTLTFPVMTSSSHVEVFVDGVKQTGGLTVAQSANQLIAPGGSVAFTTAPAAGAAVRTQGTPLTQEAVFPPGQAKTTEKALKRLAHQAQQTDRRIADADATHAANKASQAARDSEQDRNIATRATYAYVDSAWAGRSVVTTTGAFFVRVPSDAAGTNGHNVVVNPETNSIAADVHSSTIAGGGLNGFLQRIGTAPGSNASYATIGGGYDNRNDMLAGTICGGAHHVLDSSGGANRDHGTIVGGSWHTINAGPYNFIGGGTSNEITGSAQRATIAGGQDNAATGRGVFIGGGSLNTAAGDSCVIAGGSRNDCDSNAIGGSVGGGTQNDITGSGATYGSIAGGTQNKIRNDGSAPTYASVGGGLNNVASNFAARIGGGENHVASGNRSFIGGGSGNTASNTRAVVVGGAANVASGADSAVFYGQQNEAKAAYSSVRGLRGKATIVGQQAMAVGHFAAIGDAQTWETVMRRQTTDAAASSITTDGSALLVLPDNTTWTFDLLITARNVAANEHAGYRLVGVIKRDVGAATTAIVGSVSKTEIAETVARWDVSATADPTSGDLRIRVTGEAAKTIRWVAHARVASVTQ